MLKQVELFTTISPYSSISEQAEPRGRGEIPGYTSRDISVDMPSYSSPSDHMESIEDGVPMGSMHGSPVRPQMGDRTLRKGPFVYRE